MNPLKTVTGTLVSGLILAAIIAFAATSVGMADSGAVVIFIHVAVGVAWIGLLYYFNFVQVQALADAAADEGGPEVQLLPSMWRRGRCSGSAGRPWLPGLAAHCTWWRTAIS